MQTIIQALGYIVASPQGQFPRRGRKAGHALRINTCLPVYPGATRRCGRHSWITDTAPRLGQHWGHSALAVSPHGTLPLHRIWGGTLLAHSVHHWVTAQAYSCYCFIIGFIWTLNIHLSINKIIGLASIIKLHLPLVTVWEVLRVTPYTTLKKMTFFSLRLSKVSSNNFQYCLDKTQAWFGTLILATGSKHFHTSTLNCIKSMTVPFSPASSRRGN